MTPLTPAREPRNQEPAMPKPASKRRPGHSFLVDRQRAATEKIVIAAMRGAGPMSRRDIREKTGLAAATVSRTVERLYAEGRLRRGKEVGWGGYEWQFVSEVAAPKGDDMHPFYGVMQQWLRAA
jgi:predicted transcriptional regulator